MPLLDRRSRNRDDLNLLKQYWNAPERRTVVVGQGSFALTEGRDEADFDAERTYFLGLAQGRPWFARAAVEGEASEEANLREGGLDQLTEEAARAAQAVVNWHRTTTRCATCGEATQVINGGFARQCPACGALSFPRTDPAMIAVVVDAADRILLAHQGTWGARRMSLLAGFVEAGESAEDCVVREVAEECALHVSRVRYVASQAWPFPRSLMLGFLALAEGEVHVDGVEIKRAAWFTRAELDEAVADGSVVLSPGGSIARQMIDRWRAGELGLAHL